MLAYRLSPPAVVRGGAPVLVLLHGRGADERDLLGLRPHLPADVTLVCPRAPHPGGAWGYGPGWAWYRFLGSRSPDPESFEHSQAELETFLRELPAVLPAGSTPAPIVLGGFSQGGVMSLAYALRTAAPASAGVRVPAPHVVNLSGFLPELETLAVTPETVASTRFLWGHGTEDRQISLEWAEVGREALRRAGADLEVHDYPSGHTITKEELDDLSRWLDSAGGGVESGDGGGGGGEIEEDDGGGDR
jgi:phospholipase/carboxylesterase